MSAPSGVYSLSTLSNEKELVDILAQGGLTEAVAMEKAPLFQDAARKLVDAGYASETMASAYWVPGRIEVVGKHTDYAGGRSLLGAVSKGFCIVAVDREDAACRIFSTVGSEEKEARIPMTGEADPAEMDHWALYPVTTINRLVRNFGVDKGVDFAIGNDIPGASGMSTSSAMVCAVFLVIGHRNNIAENPIFQEHLPTKEDLYGYLGCCENGQNYNALLGSKGVGTFGGSEDHTAIMSCTPDNLNMFSYCDTRFESAFAFPTDIVFVIASSGAVAEKTGDKMDDYNNAAFQSFAAADAYCDATGVQLPKRNLREVVKHARDASGKEDVLEDVKATIASVDDGNTYPKDNPVKWPAGLLAPRFHQFYVESECIVAGVGQAFASKDFEKLGELVDLSQELTDTHLKNLVPETRRLPQLARALGAYASSAFGAGFGGSCWATVDASSAEEFSRSWKESYLSEFPGCAEKALFFVMSPGPGAFRLGSSAGMYTMS
jgi:galactokinase